jgi:hypothetical protein
MTAVFSPQAALSAALEGPERRASKSYVPFLPIKTSLGFSVGGSSRAGFLT